MSLPADYAERVYAGVLGKLIGVYLGRPVEGWDYQRIVAEVGEITDYIHDRFDLPLVVSDDDISGTFTFLRALPDYGLARDLTPRQIGQTWLNYIVERKAILWWGGMGTSTEHTAYLRLKHGIAAPRSGAIATNGRLVAEQIGAQIFIDGWAMVAPGDPQWAADLARRAASVSHDGEAVYAAQVVAALESGAFVEHDLARLLDTAVSLIPRDAVIARLIADLREWHAREPDWRTTRERIATVYGYDTYGGVCHVVPNHALIILALLYGGDDLRRALTIVTTSGWDTDCNAGNVGCLLGIRHGLAALEGGPDWRGPLADRLYLPTADGGRCITDAATEALSIVNIGRAWAGQEALAPKGGARYHFELPGSVQGFLPEHNDDAPDLLSVENVAGHSRQGRRSLALRCRSLAPGLAARAATATFIPPHAADMVGYGLLASPSLYPGQALRAAVEADAANAAPITCSLYLRCYGAGDTLASLPGPHATLGPGDRHEFAWRVPATGGRPLAEVGVEVTSGPSAGGTVYLDYLTWEGVPTVSLVRPADGGTMWRRAWVDATDQEAGAWGETYRLINNEGLGMMIQGTREWRDYQADADLTPYLAASCGLAVRVQGLRRYYALMLCSDGMARLVKALDGARVLAEAAVPWRLDTTYHLSLLVEGARLQARVGGHLLLEAVDQDRPLDGGAIALLCEDGSAGVENVRIAPYGSAQ